MPDFTEKTDDYLIEYVFRSIDDFMFQDVDVDVDKDWSVASSLIQVEMSGGCLACDYKPEEIQTEVADRKIDLEETTYTYTREAITQDIITHMYTEGCLSSLLKDVFKQRREQRTNVKKAMQMSMVKDLLVMLQEQEGGDDVDLEDLLKERLADLQDDDMEAVVQ